MEARLIYNGLHNVRMHGQNPAMHPDKRSNLTDSTDRPIKITGIASALICTSNWPFVIPSWDKLDGVPGHGKIDLGLAPQSRRGSFDNVLSPFNG